LYEDTFLLFGSFFLNEKKIAPCYVEVSVFIKRKIAPHRMGFLLKLKEKPPSVVRS